MKLPIKVLYFSMACNEETWNKIQQKSKTKGSTAPLVFDTLLLKGLHSQSEISLNVYSFPSVPSFPNNKIIGWGLKRENISEGLFTRWLPAFNLPFIKHVTFFFSAFFIILFWIFKNRKQKRKQIVIYSQFLPVALAIIFLSKLAGIQCATIVTDVPQYLFLTNRKRLIIRLFEKPYVKLTEIIQARFDKYVFLTEQMNTLINKKNKPYIIIEGICDPHLFGLEKNETKSVKKAIMYAGGLNVKFGLQLLIDAFKEIEGNFELWIFGSGDYETEIIKHSQMDGRIKYFGKVNRNTVLEHEVKATLLVNLRNPEDELTKFSFPSKTMEYMSSGTPLLTTRLPGIPDEYFDYCFSLKEYNKDGLLNKIKEIIQLDPDLLETMGQSARDFVFSRKNATIQGHKLKVLLLTT